MCGGAPGGNRYVIPTPSPRRKPGSNQHRYAASPFVGEKLVGPRPSPGRRVSRHRLSPTGERGITPQGSSNGRQPVRGCSNQTSVAVRSSLRTTDGDRTKPSIRPCDSGRRRGGLASCPSDHGGLCSPCADTGADRSRSRCQSAVWRSPRASTGHQAEARSEALTAHRTRCGRVCNQYGDKCQVESPHLPNEPRHPVLDTGLGCLAHPPRSKKSPAPCQHGATAKLGVKKGRRWIPVRNWVDS